MDLMTEPILSLVRRTLVDVLDLDLAPDDIPETTSLFATTIGLDSLTLLQLITRLEKELSCEIDDEAVMTTDLVDVASLVELVRGQLPDPADAASKAVTNTP
jgi:acyl carrier protein